MGLKGFIGFRSMGSAKFWGPHVHRIPKAGVGNLNQGSGYFLFGEGDVSSSTQRLAILCM